MAERPSYRVEPDADFADRLERVLLDRITAAPTWEPIEVERVAAPSPVGFPPVWTAGDVLDDALDDAFLANEPSRGRWLTTVAIWATAAAVLVVAITVLIRSDDALAPIDLATPTVEAPEPALQPSPFEGSWLSIDSDGSTQTMEIRDAGDGNLEFVVRDDVAGVCSGASSTMTGTGRLDANGALVIAQPVLTCDDGTEPAIPGGQSIEEALANLTLTRDETSDELSDNLGVVWVRPGAATRSATSGALWPQSTAEDVRAAQALADAGDPAVTWQLDAQLASGDGWEHLEDLGAEIVERFLREELGWEDFVFHPYQDQQRPPDSSGPDGIHRGVMYVRCAPDATNPLYPTGSEQLPGARCAPTIDDLRYETVSLDVTQPDRRGADGIWVISGWRTAAPFAQANPESIEADAIAFLEDFLEARLAGSGAEGYVRSGSESEDPPLLYATSTGAAYERFEIERVGEPRWPYGEMDFTARLFADGGGTVVEQRVSRQLDGFSWSDGQPPSPDFSYAHLPWETTENGKPVALPQRLLDGSVSISAAPPWLPNPHFEGALAPDDQALERVAVTTDPLRISCSPIPSTGDLTALVSDIRSDLDLVATAAAEVSIGGFAGVQLDVTLAAGASACPEQRKGSEPNPGDRTRGTGFQLELGSRMRLYLADVPDGTTVRTLAIAVVAPDARFDTVLATTEPIIGSIEWVGPPDITVGDVLPDALRNLMATEFELSIEDAGELIESFDTLLRVETEISVRRSDWSEDAVFDIYLVRRNDPWGTIRSEDWPEGHVAWLVDVDSAGVRAGAGGGVVDRVFLLYDAETGELISDLYARPQGP